MQKCGSTIRVHGVGNEGALFIDLVQTIQIRVALPARTIALIHLWRIARFAQNSLLAHSTVAHALPRQCALATYRSCPRMPSLTQPLSRKLRFFSKAGIRNREEIGSSTFSTLIHRFEQKNATK